MSKMQGCDANSVLIPKNPYLVCLDKRNHPRINYKICEKLCKNYKKCPYYSKWYEENFDESLESPEKKIKRITMHRKSSKKKGGK